MSSLTNVGPSDRAVRLVLGLAAVATAFLTLDVASGALPGIVTGAVGVVLILTAAVRICPAYLPFKISTCRAAK